MFWPDYNLEQLFDLKTDPLEEKDIAAEPAAKKTLEEMRARFAELKAAAR
jgi:hypothetical protein